jgi:hypothetical protein
MKLLFTIATGPRQRSNSQVRVPQDSWPHFTASDSRPPKPGGPGPHIYIPQEQGGQVTGFPFHRLLRLAGLRWGHSNPPPNGLHSFQSQSYVTTDGQSASLSYSKAPIGSLRPELYYCQTLAGLLMWGALSDERIGLSFCQSHSQE